MSAGKVTKKSRELPPLPQIPPSQTLYVTNLPTNHPPKQTLRLLLYTLFSTYGPVLDVVALRTPKMRGKAHIVFRDVPAATQAMRALQGWEFLGLPLRINYARGKSNVIARLQGSYDPPTKKGVVENKSFVALPGSAAGTEGAAKDAEQATSQETKGVKRPREEEEEEDDEEGSEMEMDDD